MRGHFQGPKEGKVISVPFQSRSRGFPGSQFGHVLGPDAGRKLRPAQSGLWRCLSGDLRQIAQVYLQEPGYAGGGGSEHPFLEF